jgi:hypothetical protein
MPIVVSEFWFSVPSLMTHGSRLMAGLYFLFFLYPVFYYYTLIVHIARGAHGVSNKNKNFVKDFISWPFNYLSQKTSCGWAAIFARIT